MNFDQTESVSILFALNGGINENVQCMHTVKSNTASKLMKYNLKVRVELLVNLYHSGKGSQKIKKLPSLFFTTELTVIQAIHFSICASTYEAILFG